MNTVSYRLILIKLCLPPFDLRLGSYCNVGSTPLVPTTNLP
jgi:hypothetical protein